MWQVPDGQRTGRVTDGMAAAPRQPPLRQTRCVSLPLRQGLLRQSLLRQTCCASPARQNG